MPDLHGKAKKTTLNDVVKKSNKTMLGSTEFVAAKSCFFLASSDNDFKIDYRYQPEINISVSKTMF